MKLNLHSAPFLISTTYTDSANISKIIVFVIKVKKIAAYLEARAKLDKYLRSK